VVMLYRNQLHFHASLCEAERQMIESDAGLRGISPEQRSAVARLIIEHNLKAGLKPDAQLVLRITGKSKDKADRVHAVRADEWCRQTLQ